MPRLRSLTTLLLVLALGLCPRLLAEDAKQKADKPAKPDAAQEKATAKPPNPNAGEAAAKPEKKVTSRPKPPTLPPEREQATRDFAEKQHPELARLLTQLKKTAPGEYAAAITELDRARERLEKVQERQPERYDAELQEWTLTSHVRLLLARMAMHDDPQLDEQLTTAVQQRQDLRRDLLTTERERITRRLQKVESLLKELKRDDAVEREVTSLKKGASAAQSRVKSKVKANRPNAAAAAKPASKSDSPPP